MFFAGILGVLFFVLTCVGVGLLIVSSVRRMGTKGRAWKVALTLVSALLLVTIPFSFRTVDTGEIVVVKHLGKATDIRSPGTHFDFWMTDSYMYYDAKVQNVDIATAAYSSDAQTMDVTMTLQYQIMSDKVIEIAEEYGSLEVLQNRIQSIAIEKTKSVLSTYKAMDIISQRANMSPLVENAIKDAIGNKYFVNVSTVVLTNIDFSDAFEKAVEDKMIAEQNQLRAEYENAAKIAAAEAEAKAAIQKAEGEATAKLKAAEAQIEIAKAEAAAKLAATAAEAEALRIQSIDVARMLGFTIVTDADGKESIDFENSTQDAALINEYLKYIKYLETWNGELPDVVTDGSGLIISPNP